MLTSESLGWVTGWLEGEGSFGIYTNLPRISAQSTDKDVLDMLVLLIGGTTNGPYQRQGKRYINSKPYYSWHLDDVVALEVMNSIYPLMSQRRREQINKVFLNLKEDGPKKLARLKREQLNKKSLLEAPKRGRKSATKNLSSMQ